MTDPYETEGALGPDVRPRSPWVLAPDIEFLSLIPLATAGTAELESLLRSLGARMRPDDDTDAGLTRGGAYAWVHLRRDGRMPVPPEKSVVYGQALARPTVRWLCRSALAAGSIRFVSCTFR
jgi:hypothetical protein